MKTKHKILSVLTILAIVATLFVVVAAPASAAATVSPAAGYTFGTVTGGTAAFSAAQHHSGAYSAELVKGGTGSDGSTYVQFVPNTGTTFAAFQAAITAGTPKYSFFHRETAITTNWAQFELRFEDPNSTGWLEVTAVGLQNYLGTTGWLEETLGGATPAGYGGWGEAGITGNFFNWGPLTLLGGIEASVNAQANVDSASDWLLERVKVELYEAATVRTEYIDDVTIAGTTYALEPAGAVTVAPNTAGSTAQYSIAFFAGCGVGNTYVAGTDFFTITFPEGTQLPTSIDRTAVTVNDSTTPVVGNPAVAPVVNTVTRTVRVYVPATTLAAGAYGTIADGNAVTITFSSAAGIKNPVVAATTYTLTVAGSYSGGTPGTEAIATPAAYAIGRYIALSPTHGARGQLISITGGGFIGGITILNGANFISQATAGTDGTFTGAALATAPTFTAGATNTIVCMDGTGAASATTATFTLDPSIAVSPIEAASGTVVTVYLYDFPAIDTFAANAAVTLQGVAGTHAAGLAGATSLSVTLPGAGITSGASTIRVTSSSGAYATTPFTVVGRTVIISPSSGAIGTTVNIQGQNFSPGLVHMGINGITLGTVPWGPAAAVDIDAAGNFVIPLVLQGALIEALPAGVGQVLLVTDIHGITGGGLFTITARAITLSTASSGRGTTVTVSGTGFRVNGSVSVSYAGTILTTTTCDGSGNFTAPITVPLTAAIPSTNTIAATDTARATITATATHSVSSASLSLSAATAAVGSTITVTGTGFAGYTAVTALSIGGLGVLPSPAPNTIADGSFTAAVLVPAMLPGPVAVIATAGGITATASLAVTAAAVVPPTVTASLTPIAGKFDQVWTLDAGTWKLYDPASPATAEFTNLTPGMGIFIHSTEAVSGVTIGGVVRTLVAGWNLVGIVN